MMNKLKIGVIREGKNPPDKRVPFTPEQCKEIINSYPQIDLVVQPSPIRCFEDNLYINEGIKLQEDLSDRDILFGVKEVPIYQLLENKQYFFFSHTHKLQPYNRDLINAIIEKNIQMVDYECLTFSHGPRVLGFGRFAGIVGAYNGMIAYGKKYQLFDIKKAEDCLDFKELLEELKKVKLKVDTKIILTGKGRVANGALEILRALNLKEVNVDSFLNETNTEPVFCHIDINEYNIHKDELPFDKKTFYNDASDYKSNFGRFTKVADVFIAGHYWDNSAPIFFSKEDAQSSDFKIKVIADISCDIACAIPSTLRPSTIADPIYDYDQMTGEELPAYGKDSITVMAVDNLPCELPRDASFGFGSKLIEHIIPQFFNNDEGGIIKNATLASQQKLTEKYTYMQDFVDGLI